MEKINVWCIFSNHFGTLKHHTNNSFSKTDLLLFYVLPLAVSILLTRFLSPGFLSGISTELITFYSVLGGFMINLLVLVYGFDVKKFKTPKTANVVLEEIAANISYLVTIASVVILVLFSVKIYSYIGAPTSYLYKGIDLLHLLRQVVVVLILSSLINFSLTILMVLRRFYALDKNKKIE